MTEPLILDNICEFIIDTKHKTPKFTEFGYPCIRTPNIGRGYFILANAKYVDEASYIEWTTRATPSENDLVLAREAPVGNVAIIPPNLKVCHGQRTVLIRPDNNKVNPNYLMYLMLGDEIQAKMHSMASGATVAHLNMSDIRALNIPELPDVHEQKKIAGVLKAYDNLIENNNRRIAILEDMAQSLYQEWFVNFRFPGHQNTKFKESSSGLILKGWEVKVFGDLVDFRRDSVKKGLVEKNTPYMGLEHFPRKSIALSEWELVEEIGSSKLEFKKGDVLFGKIRPYFHKVGVAQTEGLCSSDTFVWRAVNDNLNALVSCIASSNSFVAHSTQTSQGTKMPRANWNVLKEYGVCVPDNDLLDKFQNATGPMIEQIIVLSNKQRNLKMQRDLLLPQLISGTVNI